MRIILSIGAILLTGPFALCVERSSTNSGEPGWLLHSSLNLEVYTSQDGRWNVTSTIIFGRTQSVLVDAQYLKSDAMKLADRIAATKTKLLAIIITHPHEDHYLGLEALHQRFPEAPIYISASGLEAFKRWGKEEIDKLKKSNRSEAPASLPMSEVLLIGGLSWFSTSVYYRTINQLTSERLGATHSAKLLLYSVDFNDFRALQEKNDWEQVEGMLTDIARRLENAGADCIVMCTNTPHLVADTIRQKIQIPLLHIAEVTAEAIVEQGMSKVGLIGTKFTMENAFFKDRLAKFGLQTLIPDDEDRNFIHASIFNELTRGAFQKETKHEYLEIIEKLRTDGAQGVILGCTEISLLVTQADCNITVFDTAAIHSRAAVDFALSGIP